MEKVQGYVLYRIFYRDSIVYLGRTKQPLQNRIRGHLVSAPMHRTIDIEQVSKIEFARFQSEADMNLYEIYFINLWKPFLNVDDKCRDDLTVRLPDVEWTEYKIIGTPIWEKWRNLLRDNDAALSSRRSKKSRLTEQLSIWRFAHRQGGISDETYEQLRSDIEKELDALEREAPNWI